MDTKLIKRFDLVRLKTIKNVVWVSGPSGRPATPQGLWSVVGNVGKILFIAKDETIAQIPVSDVLKVADYDLDSVLSRIKQVRSLKDLTKFKIGGVADGSSREEGQEI